MNKTSATASDDEVRELAALVATLNRFLMRLSTMLPFQEAGMGFAEWSVLSIIADNNGVNNRQLANGLGVSPQRINQITDSLKTATLISITSSSDDARKKIISITPLGATRLSELNAKLQPKIAAALQKRPGLLSRTKRIFTKNLMRIVVPTKKEATC